MNIEVVAIGNEIVNGHVVNSNAATISRLLLDAGYKVQRHTSLPDDFNLLKNGLQEALERSQLVIATGGLGPTSDDFTRAVICELFQTKLVVREDIKRRLNAHFHGKLLSLEDQSSVPESAEILENSLGTAQGLILKYKGSAIILLPGVPIEVEHLVAEQLIPYLKANFPIKHAFSKELLHFFNTIESEIDPVLREVEKEYPEISFGIYPHLGYVTVALNALIYSPRQQERFIAAGEYFKKVFSHFYLPIAAESLERELHEELRRQAITLALAESCTGGSVSARLTEFAGASAYFMGSVVCYSNFSKMHFLNVSGQTLAQFGAVSRETVLEMVQGVQGAFGSELAGAVTGIAGPDGGASDKPVGTVWLAAMQKGEEPHAFKILARGNRKAIIQKAGNYLLYTFIKKLKTGRF